MIQTAKVITICREMLEAGTIKATYDGRTDTLSIVLKPDVPVAESDEDKPGVILDYDVAGNLVSGDRRGGHRAARCGFAVRAASCPNRLRIQHFTRALSVSGRRPQPASAVRGIDPFRRSDWQSAGHCAILRITG